MTLPLSLVNTTSLRDIEPWMFKIARERPGMYTIRVHMPDTFCCPCEPASLQRKVVVNITGEEFAKLDKVIMNQTYAESKSKVQSAIVFQHASVIWPSHTPDDVTMRTLGAWAITQYRCNGSWMKFIYQCFPCCSFLQKQVRLDLKQGSAGATVASAGVIIYSPDGKILCGVEPPGKPRAGMITLPCGKKDSGEADEDTAVRETREEACMTFDRKDLRPYKTFTFCKFNCRLFAIPNSAVSGSPSHPDKLLQLNYRSAEEIKHQFAEQCIAQCLQQCIKDGAFDPKIFTLPAPTTTNANVPSPTTTPSEPTSSSGPPRNDLGYVEPGHGNDDLHPLGGVSAEDSQIRAERQDRVVENEAGVGVVGQSTDPSNGKQIVGVVSLPVTDPPNVYAKEAANVESAIDNRITKKQRPFTATKDDKALLGRMVSEAIGDDPRRSLFSARRVTAWWEKHLFADLKSGKWTEDRLSRAIEGLCCRIQPSFKLSCDVKLEPMPEGKAPRMLIADGDEGQVLALLTICCIEDLIKKHLPKKTIKGLGKRPAMERVAGELRAPKAAYAKTKTQAGQRTGFSKMPPPGVSIFEGDGSAWDTTCSIHLRDCVENPVIIHVGSILKVMMAQPDSWVDAHGDISVLDKLTITFKKNGEFRKFLIDAIRRSGHRGTSCLNWWVNFVCWHCAIFEKPEIFLDPDVRYGNDHTGTLRWIASAFEGDDSILSTTPRIEEKSELYVSLMQRWERLGFNMKIFIREKRALFTGYYMALDNDGPTGVLMPEVDRCFARAGISCSPSMIEYFKKEDRAGCQSVSRAAALSRAYEFAGCSPTISTKYLRYYESLTVKTNVDRDLQMRTCGGDAEFSEPDIVAEINLKNGAAMTFDSSERDRLAAVGFECTEEELSQFSLRMWEYDLLKDWEGFRESLPKSWRSA